MTRSRFTTIMMSALLLVIGASCSSDALPTGPSNTERQPAVSPLLGGLLGGDGLVGTLLSCSPQSYAVDSKVIGYDGGTLHIGAHTFVVPRGALSSDVRITGETVEGRVVAVSFAPEGLKFDSRHQPRLTLDYSSCGLVVNLLPKHIAYTDDNLSILSILSSVDDLLRQQVSANIKHFSRYAVAW